MEYLAIRKVFHMGTVSPSMGPIPDLAGPTYYTAFKYGEVFTESRQKLSQVPVHRRFLLYDGIQS